MRALLCRRKSNRNQLAVESLETRRLLTSVVVNTPFDGLYPASSGLVSLRNAIATANSSKTATAITFDAKAFATPRTITLNAGVLALTHGTVTINGPIAGVTISGNHVSEDFLISSPVIATFSGLTITQGLGVAGIVNEGSLTMTRCTVSANIGSGIANLGYGKLTLNEVIVSQNVSGLIGYIGGISSGNGNGGGIANAGSAHATITNSTLSGNIANYGGGIDNNGTLTLTNVTLSGNTAQIAGGGIYAYLGSTTITNVTVAANATNGQGGGIYARSDKMIISDATISGNTTLRNGGGIFVYNPVTTLTAIIVAPSIENSIVAGNSIKGLGVGPDVYGDAGSLGWNLIGETDGSTGWNSADLTGTMAAPLSARLGALANNGGPTLTMAPLTGSPAIKHGFPGLVPAGITTDERGLVRVVNGTLDIGAVEVTAPPVVVGTASISGQVFDDVNGNGKREAAELGLGLWTVYIDVNNDGKLDTGDISTVTDANGNWSFSGLNAGTYVARVVQINGTKSTTSSALTIKLAAGQHSTGSVFGEIGIA